MTGPVREVHLPEALCHKAEQRFAERFGGLDNFLTLVLTELVQDDAAQLDQREQQMIEERLRQLGYV